MMFRNRVIASLCFTALLLLAFLSPGLSGGILMIIILSGLAALGSWEFFALTARAGMHGYPWPMALMGVGLMVVIGVYGLLESSPWMPAVDGICVMVILTVGFVWVSRKSEELPEILSRLFVSMFGFFYVCWCLSFVLRVYFIDGGDFTGRYLALFLVAVTKLADMGAYSVGVLTAKRVRGNHKLAKAISPKKSWEGLLGGISTAILVALLFTWGGYAIGTDVITVKGVTVVSYHTAVVFGFFAAVFGLLGDLAASAVKRVAGAEDSGNIPGVGGALDLADSLILVAPVFYLYVSIVVF